LIFTVAHRLKVLNLVVKTYEEELQYHGGGLKKSWIGWLHSEDAVQVVGNAFARIDEPNKTGESQLHWAAYLGLGGLVKSLLNRTIINNEARNCYQETALHVAAQNGACDVVKTMVEARFNLAVRDKNGATPIHHASANGRVATVATLLDVHRGLADYVDDQGFTALHLSSQQNRVDIIRLLLDSHCSIDKISLHGLTSLHLASIRGHIDIVKLLLQNHANVNVADKTRHGFTASHWAASYGHREITKLLLEAKADMAKTDVRVGGGVTALVA
jgi:ankyrin repeat protein